MRLLTSAPVRLVVLVTAVALGCGNEFKDERQGVLDLATFYPGGTRADPAAGLPEQIDPQPGFVAGEPGEYYDFGIVPSIINPTDGRPTAVRVAPMYFFFDAQERPMFSKPVRDRRDGVDWMRGGKNVTDPNPKDFCAGGPQTDDCRARNAQEAKKSYPTRRRDLLVDPLRRVADYQRPLVDVSPEDTASGSRIQYTGLWEVMEVIAPAGYEADSIKHVATLQKGIEAGDFKVRSTGKVINCPVVDDRTYIPTGSTAREIPHPRIELWYRRLLGFCYLVNGWETLGNNNGELYFANDDSLRLDTFDVSRLVVGDGANESTQLVVPVNKAYVPAVFVDDQSFVNPASVTRIAENLIATGRPRRTPDDPPGYSPMRWLHDMPAMPDYAAGYWKDVEELDLTRAEPRPGTFQRPVVHNLPLRGVQVPCSFGPVPEKTQTWFNKQCGQLVPSPIDPAVTVVSGKGDTRCEQLGLECNSFTCYCDLPQVGYGQRCGPGIARCRGQRERFLSRASVEKDALSDVGYFCWPPWGGYCHLGCTGTNSEEEKNEGKKETEIVDSRCKSVPGYSCYGGAVCIKYCDTNVSRTNQCEAKVTVANQSRDINEGMTCQDYGIQFCAWPDGYSSTWEVPAR